MRLKIRIRLWSGCLIHMLQNASASFSDCPEKKEEKRRKSRKSKRNKKFSVYRVTIIC
jgi:hypothetical protein